MRIPRQKQIDFLTQMIVITKENPSAWSRTSYDFYNTGIALFPGHHPDSEGIFTYTFPNEDGMFLIARCIDGYVYGGIGENISRMELFDSSDEEISVLLMRLFYLLFDKAPHANKLLDNFLAQFQSPSESNCE